MLSKQKKDPRLVWRWAMIALLAFFMMGLFARRVPPERVAVFDGLRGAMLGIAIGLTILAGILKRRRGSTEGR